MVVFFKYLSNAFPICITIKLPLILGETKFIEVPKPMKSIKLMVLEKECPTVNAGFQINTGHSVNSKNSADYGSLPDNS